MHHVKWGADRCREVGAVGAIRMVARTELRRHWRGTIVVMLLVGLVGAVTLAALSGARRSSSALRRFNDVSRSSNIQVQLGSYTRAQHATLRRTPGVEGVGVVDLLFLGPPGPALQHQLIGAPVDGALRTEVDRPRLVAGVFGDVALGPSGANVRLFRSQQWSKQRRLIRRLAWGWARPSRCGLPPVG